MRSLSGATMTSWDGSGDFFLARTPTNSLPDVKTEGLIPLAIHTAASKRVLVKLAAGLPLVYRESNKST
jgi:hypothetical protein